LGSEEGKVVSGLMGACGRGKKSSVWVEFYVFGGQHYDEILIRLLKNAFGQKI
jgi:hypothetical protein